MKQDETWHAGRPWPQTHCVRWEAVAVPTTAVPTIAIPTTVIPTTGQWA